MLDLAPIPRFNGAELPMPAPSTLEPPRVATPKPKRDDRAVKIARELAVMMNFIVDSGSTEHESVAEYLSTIARPIIERDYEKAQRHFPKPKKGGGE
jgi:hypothetical protein